MLCLDASLLASTFWAIASFFPAAEKSLAECITSIKHAISLHSGDILQYHTVCILTLPAPVVQGLVEANLIFATEASALDHARAI